MGVDAQVVLQSLENVLEHATIGKLWTHSHRCLYLYIPTQTPTPNKPYERAYYFNKYLFYLMLLDLLVPVSEILLHVARVYPAALHVAFNVARVALSHRTGHC